MGLNGLVLAHAVGVGAFASKLWPVFSYRAAIAAKFFAIRRHTATVGVRALNLRVHRSSFFQSIEGSSVLDTSLR